MKHIKIYNLFTVIGLMALLFAGCQKDGVTRLRLRIADFSSGSKVIIDNTNNQTLPRWEAGDLVVINTQTCTISSGTNATVEVYSEDGNYKAVYPSGIYRSLNGLGVYSLYISQTQTYRTSSINGYAGKQVVEAPMAANADAAASGTTTLMFKNIGALLAVTVTNPTTLNHGALTVEKITVSTDGMPLWGNATLRFDDATSGNYCPAYTIDDGQMDNTSIILNCGSGVEIASGEDKLFYIAIPAVPASYSPKFTIAVSVFNTSGTCTYTMTQSQAGRGNIGVNEVANVPFDLSDATGDWQSSNIPVGAIRSKFSVSATQQVYFSAGNLQYNPANPAGGVWRIAEHQWDYVGAYIPTPPTNPNAVHYGNVEGGSNLYNNDVAPYWTYWIDLFGYGTSGYNPNNSTTQAMPYDFVAEKTYGPNRDLTGNFIEYDWGYHNAITYGNTSVPAHKWRTLLASEWNYLLYTRTNTIRNENGNNVTSTGVGYTFNIATVNGVPGVIIYPDGYNGPHPSSDPITEEGFAAYEGCVFLPCAGRRTVDNSGNPSVSNLPGQTTSYMGYYWTTQFSGAPVNIYFPATNNTIAWNSDIPRNNGCAVRLVYDDTSK